MATAIDFYGDSGTATAVLSGFFSPDADPGDPMLLLTVGTPNGDGLEEPVITDNIGSAIWGIVEDITFGSGPDERRAIWWEAAAVGGENTVTATWPGDSDVVMQGVKARTPTFPSPYVIGAGTLTWNPGVSQMRFDAGHPNGDHQTYVALTATGAVSVDSNQIVVPPGDTSQTLEFIDGCVAWADWNTNEGAHTTADDLRYFIEPRGDDGSATAIFGFMLGTDQLSAEGGLLLGAQAEILVGGQVNVSTDGELLLGGRARISARPPFPQPQRVPEDHLGCGVYQAFAFTRGLREIVTMLPFTELDWNRILDDTSEANVTIDGVANPRAFARCCAALSELEPEEHELAIYRNGWRVWSGPITDMTFPAEQCVIQASDLSWWLTVRTIHHNINSVDEDLVNIVLAYIQDAMAVDNSAGLTPVVLALAGQIGSRLVLQSEFQYALDAIGEIARTGVDWTTLDRRMLLGPLQPQPAPFPGARPYPTVIDANFRIQPTISVSGSQQGNCQYVLGPTPEGSDVALLGEYGPAFAETPDHVAQPAAPDYAALEAQYGRVERVTNESRILNQENIDFNAQTRYDLFKRPLVYISDGSLLPSTPIPIDKLLPGSIVDVHLSNVCRVIGEPYRIKKVQARAQSNGSEQIDVQWQPLGTGMTL